MIKANGCQKFFKKLVPGEQFDVSDIWSAPLLDTYPSDFF